MSSRVFPTGADYINVGSGASLDSLTACTIAAWVYLTSTAAIRGIYYKGYAPGSTGKYLRLNGSGQWEATVLRATTNLIMRSSTGVGTNKWHYLVAAWNTAGANGDQHMYWGDLTAIATEVTYGTQQVGTGAVTAESTLNGFIGGYGSAEPFVGRIARVQVFNRQLSLGEIRQIQGYPLTLSGCVGFWRPGWDDGTTVPDKSGAGNHGTITGTPSRAGGIPLKILGRPQYATTVAAAGGSSFIPSDGLAGGLSGGLGGGLT